jgi:type I site-specific restriction endonuclease
MSLSLRPYQRAAIDALYDYFAGNTGNPLVVIPTAGGKSVVIAGFIREAIAAYADTRVLILTHQRYGHDRTESGRPPNKAREVGRTGCLRILDREDLALDDRACTDAALGV